ncbi:MAG: type I-B CRISPR-associated protein Cas7/Cst2/DevR [Bacillota bacterium]|nr:type I-B CRISPR-associated protein Cas7/Cst2/DevR [Bacillota bacterium]
MKNKGLTITMVFAAESSNYGEGYSNLTVLKKMTRGDANQYSYISRQAMRYNIVEQMGCNDTPVTAENKVVQFSPEATIVDYPEIDLFGYMKTMSKKQDKEGKGGAATRSAVVRLSNAVALEPFQNDLDFLTNMGLAKRINGDNAIAQSEIHASYYAYTIAVDLDRVGEDGDIHLDGAEKARRVNLLLDTIEFLYRDIKGRRENLAPFFVIGGIYDRKNPFFENRVKISKNRLHVEPLKEMLDCNNMLKGHTHVGLLKGLLSNDDEIAEAMNIDTVGNVFAAIKKEVSDFYA